MEKIIFSDVDEVIVKWLPIFKLEMCKKGYKVVDETQYFLQHHFNIHENMVMHHVDEFNNSYIFEHLPPIDDSVYYARKLCEDFGYKFIFITACGKCKSGDKKYEMRMNNLSNIIGYNNIKDLICVDNSDDKKNCLSVYKDSGYIWVEDNIMNAEIGNSLGFNSFLYESPWNKHYVGEIQSIKSWKQIYNLLKSYHQN